METLKSNKNNGQIALKGYMYTKHKECKQFIRWKRVKKSSFKCPAILKSTLKKKKKY